MIRTLAMLVRRPDLTRQEFQHHYEEVHAPLALRILRGLAHYVRNHVVEALGGEEPFFDALSEFGYESLEVLKRNIATLASERGEAIRADELAFMDKTRNHFCEVQVTPELPVHGDPVEGAVKIVLLGKAPGVPDAGFLAAYRHSLAPLLEKASSHWHWTSRPFGEVAPRADVASLLWLRPEVFDPDAIRAWSPDAATTWRLRVDERVTRRAAP